MFNRYKIFIAYAFAIPLALILGLLAASPDELTFVLIGTLLLCLALPLFLKWHHALLILFWNSAFNAFFLPGQPNFWLLLAVLSFGMSVLNYIMGRKPFLPVPEMTAPLLFLSAVVIATALYRGGLGLKAFGGDSIGGKHYILVLGAIVGYLALTAAHVPIGKSRKLTDLFFLSGVTFGLSNLVYVLGPGFYFVYYLVPSGLATSQAATDYGLTNIDRIQGLGQTCIAIMCFLLARFGIRGLLDMTKPWRFALFGITILASLFSGFRSAPVTLFIIFVFQFYFEGLLRTRWFPILSVLTAGGLALVFLFSDKLPLSAQRAVSFLPVKVDSTARADAEGSTAWRMQMWTEVWKDVPKYLIVGKGYSIDPVEMYLTREAIHMGILETSEESMLAGDYHSGPLSILVPFGIFGVIAFLWLLYRGFRVLYSNYQYGDAKLRRINCALLSCYLAYVISFFFIFGAFNTQLFIFLGFVGLGVSLNGGVSRKTRLAPERSRSSVAQPYAIELG